MFSEIEEFMKKYIPNILTASRILFTPIVIYLGLTNQYTILIAIAILIAFTDFLDGYLARKWNVVSELGARLDVIGDKMLAIGLLLILLIKNHAFFYVLIFECVISALNLYFYFRKGIAASLLVGKFKTWIIFITIILGFVGLVIPGISIYVDIFVYITAILQVITIICYFIYHLKTKSKKKTNESALEYYQIIKPILKEAEMQRRKEFPHHINESVYAHVLRVSYDCYRIGKFLHMDYKSLAIAGLLHDFYEKPWQYCKEKKPFLQNHAFTHAREAVENSRRIFGSEMVTPKIEQIMITHMFPINRRIPRSKEAWLLTLVDKADSIDFIMHPIALYKIFRHKDYQKNKKIVMKKIQKKIQELEEQDEKEKKRIVK